MNDEWVYQNDDYDPDETYVELQFGPEDLHLIYKSVCVHLDKWVGGHPDEQDLLIVVGDLRKGWIVRVPGST